MSHLHSRADGGEQQYLEEQVRSLLERLNVSKGETQGAMKLGMQIHSHAVDVQAQLTAMGQARERVLRDLRLVRGALAELVVDITDGRDLVASANRLVTSLVAQGVIVSADIQRVLDSRPGIAVAPVSPSPRKVDASSPPEHDRAAPVVPVGEPAAG